MWQNIKVHQQHILNHCSQDFENADIYICIFQIWCIIDRQEWRIKLLKAEIFISSHQICPRNFVMSCSWPTKPTFNPSKTDHEFYLFYLPFLISSAEIFWDEMKLSKYDNNRQIVWLCRAWRITIVITNKRRNSTIIGLVSGPGFRDQTLAIKSRKNSRKSAFKTKNLLNKKEYIFVVLIFLLQGVPKKLHH